MNLTPQRLCRLIEAGLAKTKAQRQARVRFITQYSGRFYRNSQKRGDESAKASPVNLLYSAITTVVPNLVFNDPKAKATTDLLAYRDYADLHANAISTAAKRMGFRQTLRGVITDGLLMAGFVKSGLAVADATIEFGEGDTVNLTEPFLERISPDDMILDPMARSWKEQALLGNKYRADLDHLLEIGFGDADKLNAIATQMAYDPTVDKAEDISKAASAASYEPRRYVDLAEIWIPADKRIVTIPYKAGMIFEDFIHDIDFSGPPKGNYHMLGFVEAPDNVMPIAPAGLWYDLHLLSNRIARKIARQAERNKRVLAYEDDAEEDIENIADASDGETVRVNNLDKMKEVEYGGVSEKAYEWMNWVKQAFAEQAGSIESTPTSGADIPTLGQAQMVQANSTVRLGDMQNAVYNFAAECLTDVGYYLHTDPMIELPLVRRVNGADTQATYSPDSRVGEWYDYHINIEPFSMARPDPNTAVTRKLTFATNVIPAAAQAAAVLGPGFKIGPFLTKIAREVGIEDADEFLVTPEIEQWIMTNAMLSQRSGLDPGKAGGLATSPAPMVPGQPAFNPNQPNPSAMQPTGGILPDTEQAIAAQEATKPSQASTKSLALLRGGM